VPSRPLRRAGSRSHPSIVMQFLL